MKMAVKEEENKIYIRCASSYEILDDEINRWIEKGYGLEDRGQTRNLCKDDKAYIVDFYARLTLLNA